MANETIIINQANLFLNVVGRRITALPATGTIATMEKISPEAALVDGLHKTSAFVVSGSDSYRLTINVMPMSEDDSFLFAAVKAIRNLGKALAVSLTYETTTFVSGSCMVETQPVRNYNADSVEPVGWPLIGVFQIAQVGKFVNPDQLTADEILSLMP